MKAKKIRIAILSVLAAVFGLAGISACAPKEEGKREGGAEAGIYYYDGEAEEYLLTLNGGDRYALYIRGENLSGEYGIEGEALTLSLKEGSLGGILRGDEIELTYDGSQMKFLKRIMYTVSYDANGGSAVESEKVLNGKTVQKPAEPTRSGYKFMGW